MKKESEAPLVRLAIAGNVDDGKSTLVGRLLYEAGGVYADQMESVSRISKKRGYTEPDLSLITDGLQAEREQGITIDVAYRYFSTPKRKYIIIDVPGHEQYTKNMITGVSHANVTLILIDATKGMTPQSKRHLVISALLGVPHILVLVNKMDAVRYQQDIFDSIVNQCETFTAKLGIRDLQFIPVSALKGDMVVRRGAHMNWYNGSTVLNYVENVHILGDRNLIDFRFPVQLAMKAGLERGYAGRIAGGSIRKGEEVIILPSQVKTHITKILSAGVEKAYAFNGESVVLTLADEIDISRGDYIVRPNNLPEHSNSFEAIVCWMSPDPLEIRKTYLLKHATRIVRCTAEAIRYQMDIDTLHRKDAVSFSLNDIGRLSLKTHEPLFFDPYYKNKITGAFILIDEYTHATAGVGMIIGRSQTEGVKI